MTIQTHDTPVHEMDEQQKAFYEALRNPLGRACKVASDGLQFVLTTIDNAMPDFGRTPTLD